MRNVKGRYAKKYMSGVSVIEFSIIAPIFFVMVFGSIELLRFLFVQNTLQEVTRRAAVSAVNVYPNDLEAIESLKQHAVFRNSSGELILAHPVADNFVRLEYLAYDLSVIPPVSLPVCAAQNKLVCMSNPHAANCIRFVQVRICDPSWTDSCRNANFQLLFPFVTLNVPLATAPTLAAVETLGYRAGSPPCNVPPSGTY